MDDIAAAHLKLEGRKEEKERKNFLLKIFFFLLVHNIKVWLVLNVNEGF